MVVGQYAEKKKKKNPCMKTGKTKIRLGFVTLDIAKTEITGKKSVNICTTLIFLSQSELRNKRLI